MTASQFLIACVVLLAWLTASQWERDGRD